MNTTLKALKVSNKSQDCEEVNVNLLVWYLLRVKNCSDHAHKIVRSKNEENETEHYILYSFEVEGLRYVGVSSLGYEHHAKGVKGKQAVTRLSALEMR